MVSGSSRAGGLIDAVCRPGGRRAGTGPPVAARPADPRTRAWRITTAMPCAGGLIEEPSVRTRARIAAPAQAYAPTRRSPGYEKPPESLRWPNADRGFDHAGPAPGRWPPPGLPPPSWRRRGPAPARPEPGSPRWRHPPHVAVLCDRASGPSPFRRYRNSRPFFFRGREALPGRLTGLGASRESGIFFDSGYVGVVSGWGVL